jgi:hypothetical protein
MEIGLELVHAQPNRHLLLVDRKDLRGPVGASLLGTMVLLKPVTQAALAAWLTLASAERAAVGRWL